MIEFVNAKINIGLNIVGKRHDGYRLLETVFYPVGLHAGTVSNPQPFCDIMELSNSVPAGAVMTDSGIFFHQSGNEVDCDIEKNLAVRGAGAVIKWAERHDNDVLKKLGSPVLHLDKHLPDGAGMGGGSADAVFAMRLVARALHDKGLPSPDDDEMRGLAVGIGADCPVFVGNSPAYAEGIGEKLQPLTPFLQGKWLLVVKPDLHISTKEAFSGVTPCKPEKPLKALISLPVREWRGRIKNDFEDSLFPIYNDLARLKEDLYRLDAEYASLTGSGGALYGIYSSREAAERACEKIKVSYKAVLLL